MIEVAVLYSDLKVKRVKWIDKQKLKRTDVIAIAVIDSERKKRYQASIEHDYYQLIWNDDSCCLTGHDGDYSFYSLDSSGIVDWRFPFIMPENSIEFEGATIDSKKYGEAKIIFADREGDMF